MTIEKSLERLEWPRLCEHLATFATTKRAVLLLQEGGDLPQTQGDSQVLLTQTQEIVCLETDYHTHLDFSGIADLEPSLHRGERGGVLTGEELLAIALTLGTARHLRRQIASYPVLQELNALIDGLRTHPELEQEIHHCITDQGQVSDRASDVLAHIRHQQRQVRQQIQGALQRIIQRRGQALQDNVITQRGDRYVLAVKAQQKEAVPGMVHDSSASGATLYIEPESTVDLNNRLGQLIRDEESEATRIRQQLSQSVGAIAPDLWHLLTVVTALDRATARARYSLWLGAHPPRFISAQESICLRHLRHPLLLWQEQHEQGQSVVPIDLFIDPAIRVVTLTGPNTGGKTATLKALGLAALMAKAGLFIPAKEPVELPWFQGVWADIGDEQSLEQSLSTFSGHIRSISDILAQLESGSQLNLVLLDEVGAGTDPSEGTALAIALLRYLADHAHLTLATTHFGELKALKYQDPRFENASVEFDQDTLCPTYRLLWGIPGQSNALAIARRLGLKPEIIEAATTGLDPEGDQVNQVIAGLVSQRQRQMAKADAAATLLKETEALHEELTRKAQDLQAREQRLRQQQETDVQASIAQAQADIAQVIRTLQQGPQTAAAAEEAQRALRQISDRAMPPPPDPGFQPQIGDRVRLPQWQQTGEIIDLNQSGDLIVRLGQLKLTVPPTAVESLKGEKVTSLKTSRKPAQSTTLPPASPSPQVPLIRSDRKTLDLRGKRVHEAEMLLDEALNQATDILWIIHGHGTGKLRNFVQEFLKHHPSVSRYHFGDREDGGKGVTIAHTA